MRRCGHCIDRYLHAFAPTLGMPPPGESPRMPYYRVTVRVDGASGATTFVQATLCAAKANPRCSWRVLDE